jgi:WD40 repeat protein
VYYNRAAFRPDGKVLLTVSHENHVRLWDVSAGKQLALTDGPGWNIAGTTFTPDGRHVLSVSANVVYAHDAATGRELWRAADHTDTVVQVAVTPDGRTVVTSSNDGRIAFREAATGKVVRSIENPRHAADVIAVSPDGKTLAALGGDAPHDAILRRWDLTTGKAYPDSPLPPKGPKYVPSAIRYLPDGSGIAIASGTESQVPVFDPDRREFRPVFGPADGGVRSIDVSADGRMVAANTCGDSVFLWEAATGQQRWLLKDVGNANSLAFSPDGRILAIANAGKHPGGQRVVRLLDAFTGKEFHRFTGHTGNVYRLAWSPDGRRLVSAGHDASALVWEVTADIRAKLPTAALGPDEGRAAVAQLAAGNGSQAYQQMARLAASPASGAAALREVVRPVTAPDADVVAGLIRELDSPQFTVREKAAGRLAAFGEGVEGLLRKALEGKPSAEVRGRIEKLLAEVTPPDHRVRQGRALEVLERMGHEDARRLLAELAAGADGAWLTREAKASLARLTPPAR